MSDNLSSSVIDTANGYAYFGTKTSPGIVAKVRLSDFTQVGALTLNAGEDQLQSAVIDPTNGFAYFGTTSYPGKVVKVDLATFQRVGAVVLNVFENPLTAAVIDTVHGYAYFGTDTYPGRVVKVSLSPFAYVATLVFQDYSGGSDPFLPHNITAAVIDPVGGYAYFATSASYAKPSWVIKVSLSSFTVSGILTTVVNNSNLTSAVIDTTNGYAYFGTNESPARIIKVYLKSWPYLESQTLNSGEGGLSSAVIDAAGGNAYFGTNTSTGQVVKVDLSNFTRSGAITLNSGEGGLSSAVIDPTGGYAYFGTNTSPGQVLKVDVFTPAPPEVTTNAATSVTATGATLNGTVSTRNDSATVTFEYGTDTSYGTSAAGSPGTVSSPASTAVSAAITGLTANTLYHFRVKAVNAIGTTYGSDKTFTPCLSAVTVNNNADSGAGSLRQALAETCTGGAITFDASYTIALSSSLPVNRSVTINASGTPLTLTGSSLTVSNGTLTLQGGITLNDLVNNSGIYASDAALTVTGNWSNNGSFSPGSGSVTFAKAGTQTLAGNTTFNNFTINNGATVSAGSTTLNINGDWTNNGTFSSTGTVTFAKAGTQTLTGNTTINNLTINSSSTVNASGTVLTITGNWSKSGTFTPGTGTVIFAKSGTQTLAGNTTFNNLTINSGATLSAGSSTQTINGNWTNNGTFTPGSGSVVFAKAGTQTLTGNTTFNNLTINSGTTLDVGSDTATINGTFTNNGVLKRTTPAQSVTNGGGTFAFTDGRGFKTLELTSTGGSNPGDTTLVVAANETPGTCGSGSISVTTIKRTFNITPTTNNSIAMTVRLYFAPSELNGQTANTLKVYHCANGTQWQQLSGTPAYGTDGTTGYSYVELTGITSFSPFALGPSGGAPTAATLTGFNAKLTAKGSVRMKWTTGTELDLVGFNLWRRTGNGEWVKLNDSLIAAKHMGEITGDAYSRLDKKVKPGKTYHYKLELVGANGSSTWSDVVRVQTK